MADNSNDQKSDWFGKMKDFLFAHKALQDATGQTLPHPAGWMPEDTSGVAKAAAEAGARNDAEKKAKASRDSSNRVKGPASEY